MEWSEFRFRFIVGVRFRLRVRCWGLGSTDHILETEAVCMGVFVLAPHYVSNRILVVGACVDQIDSEQKRAVGVDIHKQLSTFLPVATKRVAEEISRQLLVSVWP